jgi:hypothetical protein
MLRTLENDQKADWKSHISRLVHAYNCTRHSSTDFSPFYLFFGRHPRLPIDILLNTPSETNLDFEDFSASTRERLRDAYRAAANANAQASTLQKKNYDLSVRGVMLQLGDSVLIRKLGHKGKHKLADRWESQIYKIVEKHADLPIYTVTPENGKGRKRTLHRNHLMLITWPLADHHISGNAQRMPKKSTHSCTLPVDEDSSSTEDDIDILIDVDRHVTSTSNGNVTHNNVNNTDDVALPTMHDANSFSDSVNNVSVPVVSESFFIIVIVILPKLFQNVVPIAPCCGGHRGTDIRLSGTEMLLFIRSGQGYIPIGNHDVII